MGMTETGGVTSLRVTGLYIDDEGEGYWKTAKQHNRGR